MELRSRTLPSPSKTKSTAGTLPTSVQPQHRQQHQQQQQQQDMATQQLSQMRLSDGGKLTMHSSTEEYETWHIRFTAYILREKPDCAAVLDPDSEVELTKAVQTAFGVHLAPFIGDDVLVTFRQVKNPITQGVEFFRVVCDHFLTSAPAQQLAEDSFIQQFPLLLRDGYPGIQAFLQAVQKLYQQLLVQGPVPPLLERVLVFQALEQLGKSGGKFAPWAPTLLAKYRTVVRESTPHNGTIIPGCTLGGMMKDVSTYITRSDSVPSARGPKYGERPYCDHCKMYGHSIERCRKKDAGAGGGPAHRVNMTIGPDSPYCLWCGMDCPCNCE